MDNLSLKRCSPRTSAATRVGPGARSHSIYTGIKPVPAPVAPTPVAPTPVAPTPVAPTPVAPTPVAPHPVAPTPVAPTPYARAFSQTTTQTSPPSSFPRPLGLLRCYVVGQSFSTPMATKSVPPRVLLQKQGMALRGCYFCVGHAGRQQHG